MNRRVLNAYRQVAASQSGPRPAPAGARALACPRAVVETLEDRRLLNGTISHLEVNPSRAFVNTELSLTAAGLSNSQRVNFYVETNNIAGLQSSSDRFVGKTSNGENGRASISYVLPSNVGSNGQVTFYADAVFDNGTRLNRASTLQVFKVPIKDGADAITKRLYLDFDGFESYRSGIETKPTTRAYREFRVGDSGMDPTQEVVELFQQVTDAFAQYPINVTMGVNPGTVKVPSAIIRVGGNGAWAGGTVNGIVRQEDWASDALFPFSGFVFSDRMADAHLTESQFLANVASEIARQASKLFQLAPTPLDSNDQLTEATPLPLPGSVLTRIGPGTDVDLYRFTASAGQRIRFDVDQPNVPGVAPFNSYLRIFNAEGTQLAASDNDAAPGEAWSHESYIDFTFAAAGTYYVGVSGSGNDFYDPIRGRDFASGATGDYDLYTSVVTPAQAPFSGSPVPIGSTAVTIQAEKYDKGGQGVAYNDTTAANTGGAYRTTEGVDIKSVAGTSGAFRLSDTRTGEWLEYTVNVTTARRYNFEFRAGNMDPSGKFHLEVDGVNVTGSLSVPDTNSFDAFATVSKAGVSLSAGTHVLRLSMEAQAANGSVGSFDSFTVRPAVVPTVLQAENAFRFGAVVRNLSPGFTGTGYVDFVNNTGDIIEWTFNAASAGTRTLQFRYANGGTTDRPLQLKLNGTVARSAVSFQPTGSWSTWKTASVSLSLVAGTNKIRLTSIGSNGAHIDSLTII